MTIIFEVKFDLIKFEPHEVKLIFLLTSEIVLVFDFLTLGTFWEKLHKFKGNDRK